MATNKMAGLIVFHYGMKTAILETISDVVMGYPVVF
jgi:hypothetical protein